MGTGNKGQTFCQLAWERTGTNSFQLQKLNIRRFRQRLGPAGDGVVSNPEWHGLEGNSWVGNQNQCSVEGLYTQAILTHMVERGKIRLEIKTRAVWSVCILGNPEWQHGQERNNKVGIQNQSRQTLGNSFSLLYPRLPNTATRNLDSSIKDSLANIVGIRRQNK